MHTRIAFARGAAAAALFALVACGDEHHHHHEGRLGRLVVADGTQGLLTVVDLDEGAVLTTLEIDAPARINAGEGRRFAYAHQSAAGIVHIVDSGIIVEDHGDHAHTTLRAPSILDFALPGVAPVHFTHHDGQAVIFFDGAQPMGDQGGTPARVVIVPEIDLALGTPSSIEIALDAAQHGVAVPVGNGLLVSTDVPAATGASNPLPRGVMETSWEGDVRQTFAGSCEGLHGEATLTPNRIAFACAAHVLVLERANGEMPFTARTLTYPDTRRAGTLAASLDGVFLFGNHADDTRNGLIRIDVMTNETREIAFGAKLASFAVVPDLEDTLVVLTMDGQLHVVDTEAFEVVHTFSLLAPFTASHSTPSPGLAVAADVAYVSDTAGGSVIELLLAERERGRTFTVPGAPASLVVLGPATPVEDEHAHED